MSGTIGHTMYAILAAKAAKERKLPISDAIQRHYASYLSGSYLGADVITVPGYVCQDTGQEVGYCAMGLKKSPITGGPLKPWRLESGGKTYAPIEIWRMFYGRSHLNFGWSKDDKKLAISWKRLPDYLADVLGDAVRLFDSGLQPIAYVFGWMTHIVGDALIKSIQPGVPLHLLDGKYPHANRPLQDLVTFHEVGRGELKLDWRKVLDDVASAPVEPLQCHYMRVAQPRGDLAKDFPDGWTPQHEPLLKKVMAENRRYQRIRNTRLLKQLELRHTPSGRQCDEELSRRAGGLGDEEMVDLAGGANFRHALWQIQEATADLFEEVVRRQPLLQNS